jgi:hypothetical protein
LGGFVAAGHDGGQIFGEGGNHGSIVLGGHSTHKYGIEVIDVCHKYLLHGFDGADKECAQEVGVHFACVEVGNGAKQNMSWEAQISSSGWRLLMLRRAWMMAGCMIWVD